jgi:hypothetical protein
MGETPPWLDAQHDSAPRQDGGRNPVIPEKLECDFP